MVDAAIVPGTMRCAKCNFVLTRTDLYMGNGTTGPGNNKTERCPNGCGPLWPMTWEQMARDLEESCIEQMDRAITAEADIDRMRAALEAVQSEIPLSGNLGELVDTALVTRTSEPQIDGAAQAAMDAMEAAFQAGFRAGKDREANPLTAWTRWITSTSEPSV